MHACAQLFSPAKLDILCYAECLIQFLHRDCNKDWFQDNDVAFLWAKASVSVIYQKNNTQDEMVDHHRNLSFTKHWIRYSV